MSKRKSEGEAESDCKKRKNTQKYIEFYSQLWSCLSSSKKGQHFVHCDICNCDFSCAHGGRNDCKRHVESKQHLDYKAIKKSQKPISAFTHGSNSVNKHQEAVTNAEVLMSQFICNMNLSLSTADTMCKLVQKMCPDSKIAKEMKCGRNKTTAILHDLAKMTQSELADRMRSGPFTISTDGSNDDTSKQFPLVVRTIDPVRKTVNSELLSIPICNESATGENIFKLMDAELILRDIPWSNCIAFGSDNANVMTGHKKGVIAFMEKKQPSIYLSGCPLHLIHIAAKKAAGCLPPVDDILVDVFYYFNKSDKRRSEFQDIQQLCDLDQRKMIKHVCTRWLSIGRCVERLLVNWDALKVYFKAQHEANKKKKVPSSSKTSPSSSKVVFEKVYMEPTYAEKKVETILSFVRSPTNKLYVLFLNYTLKVYEDILTCLQAEEPKIHILRRSLQKILRSLLVRFVRPSAIANKTLDEVDYNVRYNIKPDTELVIGECAAEFIKMKKENHLKDTRIQEFYQNVVCYFKTACNYIKQKLPLNEPLLKHAEVADVALQQSGKSTSLLYFVDRFPCILQGATKDTLVEQFVTYQSIDLKVALGEEAYKTEWMSSGGRLVCLLMTMVT